MIDSAGQKDLKAGLTAHRKETEGQIKRLEQIFEMMDIKVEAVTCEAIKGILKEGDDVLDKFGETSAADAGIIFACQAVEHYEINRYGTMKEWAHELGMKDVEKLLSATLDEERAADKKLTKLAEESINMAAEGNGHAGKASKSAHGKSASKSEDKSASKGEDMKSEKSTESRKG